MTHLSIPEEIQRLQTMAVPELVARHEEVFGKPPRVKNRAWLWRRIAWKIQEQRFGGLSSVAKRHLDEIIAELDLPLAGQRTVSGKLTTPADPKAPQLGTTLTRIYKGREVRTTAVDGGWEYDGVVYRSLSAVAQAVTGSHWNGRLFFGLTKRTTKR